MNQNNITILKIKQNILKDNNNSILVLETK